MFEDSFDSSGAQEKIKEFIKSFNLKKQQLEIKKESFYEGLNM